MWLSSVVLDELYAGSRTENRRELERLERDFEKARRLLVPNLGDWTTVSMLLAGIAEKHGYEKIGQARLTNDALIAISAARCGIRVLTVNSRDYALLARFADYFPLPAHNNRMQSLYPKIDPRRIAGPQSPSRRLKCTLSAQISRASHRCRVCWREN